LQNNRVSLKRPLVSGEEEFVSGESRLLPLDFGRFLSSKREVGAKPPPMRKPVAPCTLKDARKAWYRNGKGFGRKVPAVTGAHN